MHVMQITKRIASDVVLHNHYLRRRPPISYAYGLSDVELFGTMYGVITFGVPASHHLRMSACKSCPDSVIELNRMWLDDVMPRNTGTWFLSRVLRLLPPFIVVSYADTAVGHVGYIYRAANFRYAGVTDMDRKTPRFDYVTDGKHSRDTTRNGTMAIADRVRRRPKHRYWTTTGDRREKRRLAVAVTWPTMQHGKWD